MKNIDLSAALNHLSDSLIAEAEAERREVAAPKKPSFLKYAALAACAALVVFVGTFIGRDRKLPISPDASDVTSPTETVLPEESTAPITDPNVTEPTVDSLAVTSGKETDRSDNIPMGGSDYSLSLKYINEVYNIRIASLIVGDEASEEWVNNVYRKKTPEEQSELPELYQIITDLNISKDELTAKNKEYPCLSDETISALYQENVSEMKRLLVNPMALYYDGEIYTGDEALETGLPSLPDDVVSDYGKKLRDYIITLYGQKEYNGFYSESVKKLINRGYSNLPKILISMSAGGMGYEGYMAYDASELVNVNPWTEEAIIDTLPVYKNHTTWYLDNFPESTDHDKMVEILKYYAELYGFDMQNLEIKDGHAPADNSGDDLDELFERYFGIPAPEGVYQPMEISATQNGVTIEVDGEYRVDIWLDPTIALPDEYNFDYHMSYEDAEKVAEYIKTKYADWIDIDDPVTNIMGGNYNIYADRRLNVEFYDGSGTLEEQIINYNFRTVYFSCNDEGKLWLVRYFRPNLDNKLGDYPIISVGEAYELLTDGKYVTSVPYDLPNRGYVKVELVYRTATREDYYMPYYKFYVEIEAEGNMKEVYGLNTYGAYYVPAIAPEFIDDMTVWDGHFN